MAKYKTKAAQHYRLQLDSIVKKTIFQDPAPSLEEGKQPIASLPNPMYFTVRMNRETSGGQGSESNIKTAIGGFFDKVIGNVKEFGEKAKETFEEAKMGEKIKVAGNAIAEKSKYLLDKTKTAAGMIAVKSKELVQNPAIKSFGEKTKEGFSKMAVGVSSVASCSL